ncbi:MAG: hypothetical protein NC310_09085 [Roseburia sp.]|nr:hypothetical protein [Roseburia sp.]MCM1557832.1 hypothetical protein [Anaeroplasma bactoclasticum]
MKKIDKMNCLNDSKGTYNLCRCYFNYDSYYYYFYIMDCSSKFLFGALEDNFCLDGFQIRKISDLKKIEVKDDLCIKMLEEKNILVDLEAPSIDLSSWKTILESLKSLNILIIIQDEIEGEFYMGYIHKIENSSIHFYRVDADGVWYEGDIPYSCITSVTFNDRYSKTWQEYLLKHNLLP